MKLTLVSSCGVLMESEGQKLLVDGVNEPCLTFQVFPEEDLTGIKNGAAPYDGLLALLFTHRHPDHYSEPRLSAIVTERPQLPILTPEDTASDNVSFRIGCFEIEAKTVAHTPVPGVECPKHMVYLITTPEGSVYFSADADIDVELQRRFLRGRIVDYGFFNGQYLSHPETRAFLGECFKHQLIYHIPVDKEDFTGIRRKADNNYERYSAELPSLLLLNRYPYPIL